MFVSWQLKLCGLVGRYQHQHLHRLDNLISYRNFVIDTRYQVE
jgi:hypothetical protein